MEHPIYLDIKYYDSLADHFDINFFKYIFSGFREKKCLLLEKKPNFGVIYKWKVRTLQGSHLRVFSIRNQLNSSSIYGVYVKLF